MATNIPNVVTGQFTQAQNYATTALGQLSTWLDTLNGSIYTPPTLSLTWAAIEAPAEVLTPTPATLAAVDYTAPSPEPAELVPDAIVIPTMTFGEVAPLTTFPTLPVLSYGAVPTVPSVGAVAVPDAPILTLPATPTYLALDIPTFAGVDLHEAWLTKFDTIPTLTLVSPTPYSYSQGAEYASGLLDAIKATLLTRMAGGTGLDPAVEQALWDRGRDRETQTALANEAEIMRSSEAMGFPLPPGVLAVQLVEARKSYYDKVSGLSRDISIKQADLEQENLKQTIAAGMQLEGQLIDYSYKLEQLAFESAKTQADNAIAIHNGAIERYKALLSVYQVYEGAYRTIISAELAKVDVLKALIAAEQAKADVNRTLVEQFKAEMDARMSHVQIYTAQVGAAKVLVEIEGLKINAAGEQIKAFVATVNAETAKIEAYKAGVQAEGEKVAVYKVKADVFATEAGVQVERARLGIANFDAQVRAKALEWDGFKSKLEVEKYRMQGALQGNEQLLTQYKTIGEMGMAQYGSQIKKWEVQLKDYEAGKMAAIQVAKINGDAAQHANATRMDAAKAGTQVFAQLVGSAYSMIKVSAGIDYRGSLGVSYQYSNKTSSQPSGVFE